MFAKCAHLNSWLQANKHYCQCGACSGLLQLIFKCERLGDKATSLHCAYALVKDMMCMCSPSTIWYQMPPYMQTRSSGPTCVRYKRISRYFILSNGAFSIILKFKISALEKCRPCVVFNSGLVYKLLNEIH